eukprot:764295-Hanusia_phi.AAC.5
MSGGIVGRELTAAGRNERKRQDWIDDLMSTMTDTDAVDKRPFLTRSFNKCLAKYGKEDARRKKVQAWQEERLKKIPEEAAAEAARQAELEAAQRAEEEEEVRG